MRLCKEFIIKDILDYEMNNDINILDELSQGNIFIILDLIKLGNNCDDVEAESIFNKSVQEVGYEETIKSLAYEVIGNEPDKENKETSDEKFSSFTEVLENFYDNLQTVDKNFGLSEFWSISTRYLYKYAEGVQKRYINDKNIELQKQYSNVIMIGQMLAGKLENCPQLNEDGTLHKETIVEKLKRLQQGG